MRVSLKAYQALERGGWCEMQASSAQDLGERREEGRADVMYTWIMVSGLERKKDSLFRSAALVPSTSSEVAGAQ